MNVVYVRVSTEDQDPENQIRDCVELLKKMDVNSFTVFKEHKSAWNKSHSRPVFNEILNSARKGEVKRIVVWDYDRLYRNRSRLISLMREYDALGVEILSVRQGFLSDIRKIPAPFNEWVYNLVLEVIAWIGEEESNKRSERVKIAFKRGKHKSWGRPKKEIKLSDIQDLQDQGYTIRGIARMLKVSKSKIYEVLKE